MSDSSPGSGSTAELSVGIDVACKKRKVLPIVVARWESGRLVPMDLKRPMAVSPPRGGGNENALRPEWTQAFADQTARFLHDVERAAPGRIRRIAIDAPRTPATKGVLRASEAELKRRGWHYIETPCREKFVEAAEEFAAQEGNPNRKVPRPNQLWMLVGFELFATLARGWECLEVYPQAIVRTLGATASKKTPEGLRDQYQRASTRTGWGSTGDELRQELKNTSFGYPDDRLDAFLSAWVASLSPEHREALGEPPNDAIWIPRI